MTHQLLFSSEEGRCGKMRFGLGSTASNRPIKRRSASNGQGSRPASLSAEEAVAEMRLSIASRLARIGRLNLEGYVRAVSGMFL